MLPTTYTSNFYVKKNPMNDMYLHNNVIIEVHIQSNNRIKDSACK